MSTQHSKAAKQFLKNQTYAHWHDATFWAVRTKRDNMAHGLEEWEQLREKASAIKQIGRASCRERVCSWV